MALIRKDSPVGVDKPIDVIQNAVYGAMVTNGAWTNYESYHRVYRNETKNGVKPELFTGNGNDYADVYMDDKFTVTSFFMVGDETSISDDMFTSNISMIFQVDLNKLYPTSPHRFDEEFRNQLVKVFRHLDGTFIFESVTTSIDAVYSGLDTEQVKLNDTHPCHVVRYELTANYQHACNNVFASDEVTCNISVNVTTTDETSVGAEDGTATANISGNQGTITYLWSTLDGSIKPEQVNDSFIDDLPTGTYSVLVTDSIITNPVCTDEDSGVINPAGLEPDDINNLVGWIKAENTINFNGGFPLIMDGDTVSIYESVSPATIDFTQSTGADQPTYKDSGFGVNNFAHIVFSNSIGTALRSTYDQTAPFTCISVIEPNSLVEGNIFDNESGGGLNYRLFIRGVGVVRLQSVDFIESIDALTVGDVVVVSCIVNPSLGITKLKINSGSYVTGSLVTKDVQNLTIGSRANNANIESLDAKMAEFVFYSDEKTEAEVDSLVDTLINKYA